MVVGQLPELKSMVMRLLASWIAWGCLVCTLYPVCAWAQTESTPPNVEVSKFEGAQHVVKLPSSHGNLVVAGGGRYILAHLPELRKVAVFDVSAAKIAGYVPADSDVRVVGTRDHLVVVNVEQSILTRYNLATLEKELTVASPFAGPITQIAAGSGGDGPAIVAWAAGTDALSEVRFALLDVETLQPHAVKFAEDVMVRYRDEFTLAASTNGRFFTISPGGAFELQETKLRSAYQSFGSYMKPSGDGSFYASNGRVCTFEGTLLSQEKEDLGGVVPAVTGSYYLSFPVYDQSDHRPKVPPKLYLLGESRPLVTLKDIKLDLPIDTRTSRTILFPTNRVFMIPEAKVIITTNPLSDSLILNRFDIDEALEQSGIDYLLIVSRPPATVVRGDHFEYKLDIKSKHGGLKFKLDSGPKGMEVSADGLVTWHAFKNWKETTNDVIMSVTDSVGQEVFHKFTLTIVEPTKTTGKSNAASRSSNAKASGATRDNSNSGKSAKTAAGPTPSKGDDALVTFTKRTWKDKSGKHDIEATFSMIVDKKIVVLIGADGKERRVPLDRLAAEDAYHAIECEVKRKAAKP